MNQMPQAIEFESAILFDCFVGDEIATIVDALVPDDFWNTRHKDLFVTVNKMVAEGKPVSGETVFQEDKQHGAVIAEILDGGGCTDLNHYIQTVKEKAALRRLIESCNAITKRCYERGDAGAVIDFARQQVEGIDVGPVECTSKPIGAVSECVFDDIDRRIQNNGRLLGPSTGFKKLDLMILGLQAPDLIVIAGRPSMGKTSIMQSMALAAAATSVPTIFTLEMSQNALFMRMVSILSSAPLQNIRNGQLSQPQLNAVTDATGRLHDMPIQVDEKGGLSVPELRRRLRKIHKMHGKGPVFIDYLQLMKITGRRGDRHDLEVGEITAGLKEIAKDFGVPVVVLSQLNRKLEDRGDKRPKMSDLRESGAIEQDADIILFPFRPEVYVEPKYDGKGMMTDKYAKVRGAAELIIAKHRNGPTGMVPMLWIEQTASYADTPGG